MHVPGSAITTDFYVALGGKPVLFAHSRHDADTEKREEWPSFSDDFDEVAHGCDFAAIYFGNRLQRLLKTDRR